MKLGRTRKFLLRGHCQAPPGGHGGQEPQGAIMTFFTYERYARTFFIKVILSFFRDEILKCGGMMGTQTNKLNQERTETRTLTTT